MKFKNILITFNPHLIQQKSHCKSVRRQNPIDRAAQLKRHLHPPQLSSPAPPITKFQR